MSVKTDVVDEVKAAIAGADDPKALKARLLAELRSRYPDVCAQARSQTDVAVFDFVLHERPELIERCRHNLVHADTVAPLEAVVSAAMASAMACFNPAATLAQGRHYQVTWPAGSTTVCAPDGRRWRVSWPADGTGADLDAEE